MVQGRAELADQRQVSLIWREPANTSDGGDERHCAGGKDSPSAGALDGGLSLAVSARELDRTQRRRIGLPVVSRRAAFSFGFVGLSDDGRCGDLNRRTGSRVR